MTQDLSKVLSLKVTCPLQASRVWWGRTTQTGHSRHEGAGCHCWPHVGGIVGGRFLAKGSWVETTETGGAMGWDRNGLGNALHLADPCIAEQGQLPRRCERETARVTES